MDESAFRSARDAMTPRPCAFEKAMLAAACACSLALRRNIAERESVTCASPAARAQCAELRDLLRQKSAFALKLAHTQGPLPHAKEMKVECGGLLGVQKAAAAAEPACADARVLQLTTRTDVCGEPPFLADVHSLVRACAEKFGGLANLPYSDIVQSVVAFQMRQRRSGS